jgi:hypothetical protein
MMKRYLALLALLIIGKTSSAQTPVDYSIQLQAIVQENPPSITLTWDSISLATSYQIFKKPKSSASWGPAMAFLNQNDTMYVDNNVIVDSSYEYKMVALGVQTAYGYIHAGVKAPAIHSRGAMVMLVDDYFSMLCFTELNQLMLDLAGDGWEIIRHDLPRTGMTDVQVRDMIIADKAANPRVSAVYILGHIPVPYSGYIYPDGHVDHRGAWPADVFYADLDGSWTDVLVDDNNATRPENWNQIGDGKWDQGILPSSADLQIGRVDFFNMPQFNKSEEEMMSTYLTRAHYYKMDSLEVTKRALIDDNFGGFGGEAFAANGWRNYPPLVGKNNIQSIDMIASLDDSSYQWAYACGGGSYTGASGVGNTVDFVTNDVDAIFVQMFGSYFGDWDAQNNFLRAPLCADIPALTSCWAGRPNWFFHHMALGENIGYTTRLMQNNNTLYIPTNTGNRSPHIALMGDPSLRTDYMFPPSNLTGTQVGDSSIHLNWLQSDDTSVLGYYVYRSDAFMGNYQLVSTLLTNHNFQDHALPTGTYYYQVRAMKDEMTPSGGYHNLSIGALSSGIAVDNSVTVGLKQSVAKNSEVNVYPNPAKDKITIDIANNTHEAIISIVDITGKKLQSHTIPAGKSNVSLDIHQLPAGVYAILVQTVHGTVSKQWIKN